MCPKRKLITKFWMLCWNTRFWLQSGPKWLKLVQDNPIGQKWSINLVSKYHPKNSVSNSFWDTLYLFWPWNQHSSRRDGRGRVFFMGTGQGQKSVLSNCFIMGMERFESVTFILPNHCPVGLTIFCGAGPPGCFMRPGTPFPRVGASIPCCKPI